LNGRHTNKLLRQRLVQAWLVARDDQEMIRHDALLANSQWSSRTLRRGRGSCQDKLDPFPAPDYACPTMAFDRAYWVQLQRSPEGRDGTRRG
jgi:hypothetical protein